MIEPIGPVAGAPGPREPFAPLPAAVGLASRPNGSGRRSVTDRLRRAIAFPGPRPRIGAAGSITLVALIGLVAIAATDQVVPASSAHQAQLRIWLASRAAGITALALLGVQILIGLLLSHPTNKLTWRLSRLVFPWHDTLWLFVLAFVGMHVVTIVVDPYAGVGLPGALIPGLSSYRSAPVALGTIALYALLVTGLTARWTRLLPRGAWVVIHRGAAAIFVVAWMHGLLAGTDSAPLTALYVALGLAILAATAHRLWARGGPLEEVVS
jgi:hypothetical protein